MATYTHTKRISAQHVISLVNLYSHEVGIELQLHCSFTIRGSYGQQVTQVIQEYIMYTC